MKSNREVTVPKIFPPVVTILSPKDGSQVSSTEIGVEFSIRSPSAEPVTRVRVLVDGRPVERGFEMKPVKKDENVRTLRVTIPEKDAEISVIAENRLAASEPATVKLKWHGEVKEE